MSNIKLETMRFGTLYVIKGYDDIHPFDVSGMIAFDNFIKIR